MENPDYTSVLNSINSKLASILEVLENSQIKGTLDFILLIVLIMLILYILRGE